MFPKLLIANRGEIAVRIIRACRELGIKTVAVFSSADKSALHTLLADEAVCIGPPKSADSYLNMNAILAACEQTGASALHPGFGFLSENARFVRLCEKCGVTFVGPSAGSINAMGDKANAKATMRSAGVPIIPGSDGIVATLEDAVKITKACGLPVMLKASAGGGGRGIRRVDRLDELETAFETCKREAKDYFGDDGIYIEKCIINPRHVEVQILADNHGNVVHLGERDCSIQRRNQKLIEETPSPAVTPELRSAMGAAAIKAARACNYSGAGTVEFLLDTTDNSIYSNINIADAAATDIYSSDNLAEPQAKVQNKPNTYSPRPGGRFYFMEMNTRIQVEHGITELVTGVDLVKWQILVAAGEKLNFSQDDIKLTGHSIECRINAENPDLNFRPCPGKIESLNMPGGPGVRVDSAMYAGAVIPPYYDSMIAKVMTFGKDRETALAKMRWALSEFLVDGVDTNVDFHLDMLKDKNFKSGDYHNGYLDKKLNNTT